MQRGIFDHDKVQVQVAYNIPLQDVQTNEPIVMFT